MIFSVQNSNLMYSWIFTWSSTNSSARNSLWNFSDTNGHPNRSLAYGGNDAKGLQRASYDTSTHDREPTWRNANDGGSFWSCGNELPRDSWLKIINSTSRRLPLSLRGGRISRNPITIDEDEGFSETMKSQNTPPQQPPAMEPRPALRSIENLQNSSATWQLFD